MKRVWNRIKNSKILAGLRYARYVIFHPFDGFWDLTHANEGSLGAANVIIFLTLAVRLVRLRFTGFMFLDIYWPEVSVWTETLTILVPLLLFCISNWAITTLFDGKGTFKHIYMGVGYALTPYPIIQLIMVILSNLVTSDEGVFYSVLNGLSLGWCAFLIIIALMMIHVYSLGRTILSTLASILGMLIIMLICLGFFSMLSEAISFVGSLIREIQIRVY
ncbi:MAG: YIP1 family protein [Lachnospiraceae bacterium]|nr:YIP1 family protein [Lachnospiraceae bacterium]